MGNKFSLSFGISLVIVGLLNIFFETSNIILFGLSFSTTIFSIVNIIVPKIENDKAELLYIIPFVLLISIFCYSDSLMKYEFISDMVDSKLTSILTFISFGILFISEFFNIRKEKMNQKIAEMKQTIENYDYSNNIFTIIKEHLTTLADKKIVADEVSKNFIERIDALCSEESRLAEIDSILFHLNKDEYTIEDINQAFKSSSEIIIHDELEKKMKKKKKRA